MIPRALQAGPTGQTYGLPEVPAGAREVQHWVYVDPAHDHAVNVIVHEWQERYIVSRHDTVLSNRTGHEITFRSAIARTPGALEKLLARIENELLLLGPYLKGPAGGFTLEPVKPRLLKDGTAPTLPFAGIPVAENGDAMTLHLNLSPDGRWLVALAEVPDAPASSLIAVLVDMAERQAVGEEVILHAKGQGLHRAILLRWYRDFRSLRYYPLSRPDEIATYFPGGLQALLDEVRPRVEGLRADLREMANAKETDPKRRRAHEPIPQEPRDVLDILKSRYLQSLYERYLPSQSPPWMLRREDPTEIGVFMRRLRRRFSNHHQHNLSIVEVALLAEAEMYRNGGITTASMEGFRLLRLVREAGANLAVAAPM